VTAGVTRPHRLPVLLAPRLRAMLDAYCLPLSAAPRSRCRSMSRATSGRARSITRTAPIARWCGRRRGRDRLHPARGGRSDRCGWPAAIEIPLEPRGVRLLRGHARGR
jgi:hypothetical protein